MAKGYYKYFNRDISWLAYDRMVLESALADDVCIGEALNFISFHSSNLDEFYSVRVAEYRKAAYGDRRMDEVSNPAVMLHKINAVVSSQMREAAEIVGSTICARLREQGVVLHFGDIPEDEGLRLPMREYFEREVVPNIQPILLEMGTLAFMRDNKPYFAVRLLPRSRRGKERAVYSLVRLPFAPLPRFVTLPSVGDGLTHIVFLDDIVRSNLDALYPGYVVEGAWSVKISRDADLGIRDNFMGDIVEEIRDNLTLRKTGEPVGFYRDAEMPRDVLECLKRNYGFAESEMVACGRYLNLHDLARLHVGRRRGASPMASVVPPRLRVCPSLLDEVARGDVMLHFPYNSFNYVIRLINEAAQDPTVSEIKVTQYRVATNSAVVNSLIAAARANKRVTVFVELKARFDEKNNLEMAERMKAAGIRLIYSISGVKVHAKVALIVRSGGEGRRSVAYVSTGNFNEQTARTYTDHGLLTADADIIDDLSQVFDFLEAYQGRALDPDAVMPALKKLLVSRFNMEERLRELIAGEVAIAKEGGKARIFLKMNGLQYRPLINDLYVASTEGVEVRIVVRGICCLVPGQSYSRNIRLTRLVDGFLEHGRVWAFGPEGERGVFITSSDWLNRNMRHRIEVATPILNEALKRELMQIMDIVERDNTKARVIDENLQNVPTVRREGEPEVRAQCDIFKLVESWQSTDSTSDDDGFWSGN